MGIAAAAALIGVTLASVLATENALVIRDRAIPAPSAAEELARQTDARWTLAWVWTPDYVVLQGWLFTPKRPNGAGVILLHGVGDTRLGMMGQADFLLRAGYAVLTPDARGHGASGGAAISYGVRESEDLRLWEGWMAAHGVERLYGLGESMGAAILLESLAGGTRFRAVVAESPFATFESVAEYRLSQASGGPPWAFWPVTQIGFAYARLRYRIDLRKASPVDSVRQARIPILLIHGDRDTNIPISESRRIAAANSQSLRLWEVRNGGHVNAIAVEPERYPREVLAWFGAH